MKKFLNAVVCSLTIVVLFSFNFVYAVENAIENNAVNEVNETENTTNTVSNETVRTLTLQEQQDQVNNNLNTASQQLTYVETELTSKEVQIQKLQDQIDQFQNNLEISEKNYKKAQEEYYNSEQELEKLKKQYDKEKTALKKRLRAIYSKGEISYLEVLLNSKDIMEFLSNYIILDEIADYDNKVITDIKTEMQSINEKNEKLIEKKEELKKIKAENEKQNVLLTNTKTILENEKKSLNDSELTLMAQIDSYKKQQNEIEGLINRSIYSSNYELFYTGGIMIWPTYTTSYITSPFGSRIHPIQGIVKGHNGIDIGGRMDDPVYAAADGVIIYYGWMSGYGNCVMVDHGMDNSGKKIVTLYGHGNRFMDNLRIGTVVKQGEQIMYLGSTGNSTGPHVHFEVRENGVAVDPKSYLSNKEEITETTEQTENTVEEGENNTNE